MGKVNTGNLIRFVKNVQLKIQINTKHDKKNPSK